MFYKIK